MRRSVQYVRSVAHSTFNISLVVDSPLIMQQNARLLTRCKSLFLLVQYDEFFASSSLAKCGTKLNFASRARLATFSRAVHANKIFFTL